MTLDLGEGLGAVLARINRGRLGLPQDWSAEALAAAEEEVEGLFGPAQRLAIYGTLAPGEANHAEIAHLGGRWCEARVRGSIRRIDRGTHKGLTAMHLDPKAAPLTVKLLVSPKLPANWPALDRFEGEEMFRLLVPLEPAGGPPGVVNIYTLRRAMLTTLS